MKLKKPIKNAVIFGDSYSTFEGYIPEGYAIYYPSCEQNMTDVKKVEETWWHALCSELDINLVLNDSWSGSTIGYTGYRGDCSKTNSFIFRLENLANDGFFEKNEIDTVFIFGATNDNATQAAMGEAKLEDITREELFAIRPAIAYFIGRVKAVLPNANIIFIVNTGLRADISNMVMLASEHFGTEYILLKDIEKVNHHPNVKGMAQIKEQVKNFITK